MGCCVWRTETVMEGPVCGGGSVHGRWIERDKKRVRLGRACMLIHCVTDGGLFAIKGSVVEEAYFVKGEGPKIRLSSPMGARNQQRQPGNTRRKGSSIRQYPTGRRYRTFA